MKKFIFISLVTIFIAGAVKAEDYRPTNVEFWQEVDSDLKKEAYEKLIFLANKKGNSVGKDTLENGEAELATGLALRGMGFTYGATLVLGHVLKTRLGTDVASLGLQTMEDIARKGPIDEAYVYGEIINDLEFDVLPANLQDFVSYQVGMFDYIHNYKKWSDEQYKKITPGGYWDFKLKYMGALQEVSYNHDSIALDKFTSIANNDAAPDDVRQTALHQEARMIFEKGDYPEAYKIFKKVKLNPRERGLILLERAWSKYYQKDYSKALGLLIALEAPYFDTSRSPEAYILKMIIFKELCYYESATEVVTQFNKRFGRSVQMIKNRLDLRKDQALINLSVIDQRVEKWVDFLSTLKTERKNLAKYEWDKYAFLKNMRRTYDLKIDEVRARLDWMLWDKTRDSANRLLDWQEQINFLDYQTKLDGLRVIKPKGSLPYRAEDIPSFSFDKTYWENQGEIWFDELEDYKVFVESRCENFSGGTGK